MKATLTVLGSGTSMGVPTLGCDCRVCRSTDARDKRTRPSIAIEYGGHCVVIDTGPDFREQFLREGLTRVDAVLYTHSHADHILGMDDLRPLSFQHMRRTKQLLPLYADETTAKVLRRIFDYTFSKDNKYPTSAKVEIHALGDGITLFGARFERLDVQHGGEVINGFRFGAAAYLTDMSGIPAATMDKLRGLDVLILDALRPEPHPSHSHLEQSLKFVEELAPQRAYFTHMSHEILHAETEAGLPANARLAYDGLKLEFEIA
jgi:phosphoribosyl 1,2-cyclic phosphate phosphodiesterase